MRRHPCRRCVRASGRLARETRGGASRRSSTARGETAHFEHAEHDLSGEIDVGWELVGIPADELVAAVCIDTAEHASVDRDGKLVLHRVAGQVWRGSSRC